MPEKIPSLHSIAKEMSLVMPLFIRYMHPYIFKDIEVPPSQVFALITVEEERVCNITVLAKRLNVSPPTASGLIDRLVKREYIKRGHSCSDRRIVEVSLTTDGKAVVKKFRNNILKRWRSTLKDFSPEERMGPLLFVKQILKDLQK